VSEASAAAVIRENGSVPWRPTLPDPSKWDALYAGVPSWLEGPLLDWAQRAVLSVAIPQPVLVHLPSLAPVQDPITKMLQEFDLATRREASRQLSRHPGDLPTARSGMSEDEWLEFIDFLVYHLAESSWLGQQRLDELTALLERGGSELTVGDRAGARGLVKRVPEGAAEAARDIMDSGTSAGALLAEAWHATYGRNPDPEEAYEKAVKAVEAAGVAVVTPKDLKSTLGKMIAVMRSQSDWCLPLASVAAAVPIQMAEALWQGQASRHGGNGYRKPSAEEAESAVMLAIPLVQWFSSGVVARRS
jgi:hypothetical protein